MTKAKTKCFRCIAINNNKNSLFSLFFPQLPGLDCAVLSGHIRTYLRGKNQVESTTTTKILCFLSSPTLPKPKPKRLRPQLSTDLYTSRYKAILSTTTKKILQKKKKSISSFKISSCASVQSLLWCSVCFHIAKKGIKKTPPFQQKYPVCFHIVNVGTTKKKTSRV